jgi:Flp pilus assembly protein TadD
VLGQAYTQRGRLPEGITQLRRAAELSGRLPPVLSSLGYTYALAGETAQAHAILKELVETSAKKYVSAYDLALINIGLGQKDAAFEFLRAAVEERCGWLIFLKIEPVLDSIRSDSRFEDLIRAVGLRLDS